VGKASNKPTKTWWSFGNIAKFQYSGCEEYGDKEVIHHGAL
jgi:hypothetical protein